MDSTIKYRSTPQVLVPGGSIFDSTIDKEESHSLLSCLVSPGFDYENFELLTQREFVEIYPQYESIIKRLTYEE